MKLSLSNKITTNNHILICPENQKTFPLPELKIIYEKDLVFKKDESIKSASYVQVKEKKHNHYIIIKTAKNQIDENLEKIVINIGTKIRQHDEIFSLNLDNTILSPKQKHLLEDLLIANFYSFSKYKKDESKNQLIIKDKTRNQKEFTVLQESLKLSRDLTNDNASNIHPTLFESYAKKLFAGKKNIKITSIVGKDLQKKQLNGIYEVGKWSENLPRLLLIEYTPNKTKSFEYGLIGKGVCFDAGGYNLKPTGYIEDMRTDMAGAATVLGTLYYVYGMQIKKNIIIAIPLVENLVSGNAYKPGDIIKMYNGKTVEVNNTDAEGRLILADALAYTEKIYKPNYLFDFATLTGAQIVALGNEIAAIIGNNPDLNKKIQNISWEIKERVRELPFHKPYFKSYNSEFADMNNAGWWKMGPGTILGWLFISQFITNKNWVHVDIAWPSGIFAGKHEINGYGASGFWIRLLKEIIIRE